MFLPIRYGSEKPNGYVISHGKFPTNSPFSLPFKSFGWDKNGNSFSFEPLNMPPWMIINEGIEGNGNLSGFSPKKPGIYPFNFLIRSNNSEFIQINGELETVDSTMIPKVLFPEFVEVIQFETSKIDLLEENLLPDDVVYSVDFPDWVNLSLDGFNSKNAIIEIMPREGTIGTHTLKILVKSKESSLFELIEIQVEVVPSQDNVFGTRQSDYDAWQTNWLGEILFKENSWAYHFNLGWIYLLHKEEGDGIWFWNSVWGWLWTNESHWYGDEGYLFSSNFDGWLFYTKRYNNNQSLIFNYQNQSWDGYSP